MALVWPNHKAVFFMSYHRQWTKNQSDVQTIYERFYHNIVIYVCDCQVLSEINNRTYLPATANGNSITSWIATFIRESNIT